MPPKMIDTLRVRRVPGESMHRIPDVGDVYVDMRPRSVRNGEERLVRVLAVDWSDLFPIARIEDLRTGRQYTPLVAWFFVASAQRRSGFRFLRAADPVLAADTRDSPYVSVVVVV